MIDKKIKLLISFCLSKENELSAEDLAASISLKWVNGVYPYLRSLEEDEIIQKEGPKTYSINSQNDKARDVMTLCKIFKKNVEILMDRRTRKILKRFEKNQLIRKRQFSKEDVKWMEKIIHKTRVIGRVDIKNKDYFFLTCWQEPTQNTLDYFDIQTEYNPEEMKVALLDHVSTNKSNTKSPIDEQTQKQLKEINMQAYISGENFILDKISRTNFPFLSAAKAYTDQKNKEFTNFLMIVPKMNEWKLKYIYNTDRIEGNPLTMQEVQTIITYGDLNEDKRKNAIIETNNSRYALDLIFDLNNEFNIDFMKKLHRLVQKDLDPIAGEFRDKENCVIDEGTGALIDRVTPVEFVNERISSLFEWYNENNGKLDPLLVASVVHNQFVFIHPFNDGNGRMARLIFNFILMKSGYYPIIFYNNDKDKYYNYLRSTKKGDFHSFVNYVLNLYRAQLNEI